MYNLFVARYWVHVWVQILSQDSMTLTIHIRPNFLPFVLPKKLGFAWSTLKLPFGCIFPPLLDEGTTHHCLLEACSSVQCIYDCLSLPSLGAQKVHWCCSISALQYHIYSKSDTWRVRIIGFFTNAGCPFSCAEWFEQGIAKTASRNCLHSKFCLVFCF